MTDRQIKAKLKKDPNWYPHWSEGEEGKDWRWGNIATSRGPDRIKVRLSNSFINRVLIIKREI